MSRPLVSILIPAYNSENWITHTLQSALAQTWQRKEIIVVDDGSQDRTGEVARRFSSKELKVVSTENRGGSAARNHAFELSQGDYIQWLDADDLLAPDKIDRQLTALRENDNRQILLSSPWAYFFYRPSRARFIPSSLWHDFPPVEWLLRKMGENVHMQTATWLTSRELAEAAGPWDTQLSFDDDGEYFARVLLKADHTQFVPEAGVFYRLSSSNRMSFVGDSDEKRNSLFRSMTLHVQYLRSLEESERVRSACLTYLNDWYSTFCPDRPDLMIELQKLAAELNGQLAEPPLGWKHAWMAALFGRKVVKWARRAVGESRASLERNWDKMMFALENRRDKGPTSKAVAFRRAE